MSGTKRKSYDDIEFVSANEQPNSPLTSSLTPALQINPIDPMMSDELPQFVNGTLSINQNPLVYLVVPQGTTSEQDFANIPAVMLLPINGTNQGSIVAEPIKLAINGTNNQGSIVAEPIKLELNSSGGEESNFEKPISHYVVSTDHHQISEYSTTLPRKFDCDFPGCTLSFSSLRHKVNHRYTHEEPQEKFKCSICNMLFDAATDRNKHVESHRVVDTLKCENCGLQFPYYTTLVRHMKEKKCIYSKISSAFVFTCSHCGSGFINSDDLAAHQKGNVTICLCGSRICSQELIEPHRSTCAVYKKKAFNVIAKWKKLDKN